jgi:hypothetical protein
MPCPPPPRSAPQGEANASGEESDGVAEWQRYSCLFNGLVEAWRAGLGPGPDGQPLWFSLGHLEPWNAPPEYNGVFAGLRAQQLGQATTAAASAGAPVGGLPSRVTFASAADLGDPTSPFHPVHYRNKQAFGARQAAALLATAYAGEPTVRAAKAAASAAARLAKEGSDRAVAAATPLEVAAAGGPFYPTAVYASGTGNATSGAVVVVVFDPATVGPNGLALAPGGPTVPCPVGGPYNFSAGSCAWPTVVDAAGVSHNATVIGVHGGGGGTLPAVSLAVPPSAGVADGTPLAVSYGWGVWPVLTLYAAAADGGTPALPFNLTVAAPTAAAAASHF